MSALSVCAVFLFSFISPSLVFGQWCGPPNDCTGVADLTTFGDASDCGLYHQCILDVLVPLRCEEETDSSTPCYDETTSTCVDCATALCCRGTEPLNEATLQYSSGSLDCGMVGATAYSWSEFITYADQTPPVAKNLYLLDDYVGEPEDEAHYILDTTPYGHPDDYHLDVMNALPKHAGKYRCQGQTEVAISSFAEFIVIENNVECLQNSTEVYEYVEGEYAKIGCSVFYHGAWGPVMEWSGAPNMPPLQDGSIDNYVEYFFVQEMIPDLNGMTYTCDLRFDAPVDPPEYHAENAPIYTDLCQSTLSVFYSPRNTQVRNGIVVHPGMPIECYTEANPAPFIYSWSINGTVYPFEEATITITVEGQYVVTCCATNDIRGVNHTDCDVDSQIWIYDLTGKCPPEAGSVAKVMTYDRAPDHRNSTCIPPTSSTSDESVDTSVVVLVVILSAFVFLFFCTTVALAWLYLSQRNRVVDRAGIDNPNYIVKS